MKEELKQIEKIYQDCNKIDDIRNDIINIMNGLDNE